MVWYFLYIAEANSKRTYCDYEFSVDMERMKNVTYNAVEQKPPPFSKMLAINIVTSLNGSNNEANYKIHFFIISMIFRFVWFLLYITQSVPWVTQAPRGNTYSDSAVRLSSIFFFKSSSNYENGIRVHAIWPGELLKQSWAKGYGENFAKWSSAFELFLGKNAKMGTRYYCGRLLFYSISLIIRAMTSQLS